MFEPESLVVPAVEEAPGLPALLVAPPEPDAVLVLAHGAGAGMEHRFMAALSQALAIAGVATVRWQFPYMAAGRRRPDRAPVAVAAVRRAVELGRSLRDSRWPGRPLLAGGKSFGGRMTSTAASESELDGVAGLVLVGFPLHPAGKPGMERAVHLETVSVPMLFMQGTRDKLAGLDLLRPVLDGLGPSVTLHIEEDADHGFHVRKRSGRDDEEVIRSLARALQGWLANDMKPY